MIHKVKTPIGNIWVQPQGIDEGSKGSWRNVFFCKCEYDAQQELRKPYQADIAAPGDNIDDIRPVVIRGREQRGTFHVYEWSDGNYMTHREWVTDGNYNIVEPRRQTSDWEWRRNLYLHPVDGTFEDSSKAAKDTFISKVMPAIKKWANEHPEVLKQARIAQLERKIEAQQEAIEASIRELEAKKQAIVDSREALQRTRESLISIKA